VDPIKRDLAVHTRLLETLVGRGNAVGGTGVGRAIDPLPIISERVSKRREGIITEGMYAAGWKYDGAAVLGVVMVRT